MFIQVVAVFFLGLVDFIIVVAFASVVAERVSAVVAVFVVVVACLFEMLLLW